MRKLLVVLIAATIILRCTVATWAAPSPEKIAEVEERVAAMQEQAEESTEEAEEPAFEEAYTDAEINEIANVVNGEIGGIGGGTGYDRWYLWARVDWDTGWCRGTYYYYAYVGIS